jgi:hypothetical protein
VSRHGRGGHPYLRGNLAGGEPVWGVAHQETKDVQTVFLGQGSKGFDSFFFFHNSIIKKVTKDCKSAADFYAQDLRGYQEELVKAL